MTYVAYRYRLYPTREQTILLNKTFGCVRYIYNWGLAKKISSYQETGKGLSVFALSNDLPRLREAKETAWLSEVNSQALQSGLRHLDMAFTRFFREKKGFPKFKNKGSRQSFANPQGCKVDFDAKRLYIPKFREGIKAVFHRSFDGKIKTATVSKTKTDKYFVSVLVEVGAENPKPPAPTEATTLGIDLGLKHFATLSSGEKIDNPRHLAKKLRYLKRQQRRLSRKKLGSNNRNKQRKRVAAIHEKVACARKDFLHKTTARLVKNQDYQAFAVEDLSVREMMKDKRMAKYIGDVGWTTFRTFLEYKAARVGKSVLVIGRFEPSSRLCVCGHLNRSLTLKDRAWECPSCGASHDRDILAANNIRRFAFCKQNTYKDLIGADCAEFTLGETAQSAVAEPRSPRIYSGE